MFYLPFNDLIAFVAVIYDQLAGVECSFRELWSSDFVAGGGLSWGLHALFFL